MLRLALFTATFALAVGPAMADPMPYLPIDRPIEADVMVLEAPDEFIELHDRVRQVMKSDPLWFFGYVAAAGSLAAAPYDERFGMTEAEFERYVNFMDLDIGARPIGYIELDAHSDMTGMNLTFAVTPDNHPLNNLRYNGEEDYFVTKFGRLQRSERFIGEVSTPAVGPWEGVEYGMVDMQPERITSVSLRVGQRETDNRYVLEYSVTLIERDKDARGFRVLLFYDL